MIRPAFFLLALWAGSALAAEPYRPASADTVLLQRAPGAAETLRAARGVGADDPTARAQGIAAAIREARRSGDPRYYGQAQALLGADADRPEPPPEIRLLRATLRQQRHDFAGARSDLDALLAADPRNAQARLLRANIHLVQGEPVLAKPDCAALLGQTELLVTATCIGAVGGLTGQGAAGLAAIEQSLARAPEADATLKLWALTQAAEIAERLGDAPRASGHFAKRRVRTTSISRPPMPTSCCASNAPSKSARCSRERPRSIPCCCASRSRALRRRANALRPNSTSASPSRGIAATPRTSASRRCPRCI